METLGVILIIILLVFEVSCWVKIYRIIQYRSEERTRKRRAFFRHKAYKRKAMERSLKKARQTVWEDLISGKLQGGKCNDTYDN